ncbi:MAG: hypothetical protein R3E77_15890 [Steroidobacteraceae bacterium]
MNHSTFRLRACLAAICTLLAVAGCGGGSGGTGSSTPAPVTRTWRMGFAPIPPRPDVNEVLRTIDELSLRAEIAALHEELPWADLLAGMPPRDILARDKVGLVDYLRGKGLAIYFMLDSTDGLSRAEEAPQLRALGRSLTEPEVQQLYRDYALAVAEVLHPEYLGLAAETNLIRVAAPAPLYAAVRQVANDAAADLRAAGAQGQLLFSIQVDTAWGALGGGSYVGAETDFADFPFADVVGLSSYPYFGFSTPEDIPSNYYSRVLNGRNLPVMVVEGGWTSAAVANVQSTPDLQARYIRRQAALLDSVSARALIQLLFVDLDLAQFPQPVPANLPLFAHLGVVDSDFMPKPALAAWDELYDRPYRAP